MQQVNGNITPFSYMVMTILPSIKVFSKKHFEPTGMESGISTFFVKGFHYGERLDTETEFISQPNVYMWHDYYPSKLHIFNSICYIGLKLENNKYGWIKVDMTNSEAPLFLSYAIQI